jgi:hypothetical protein
VSRQPLALLALRHSCSKMTAMGPWAMKHATCMLTASDLMSHDELAQGLRKVCTVPQCSQSWKCSENSNITNVQTILHAIPDHWQ